MVSQISRSGLVFTGAVLLAGCGSDSGANSPADSGSKTPAPEAGASTTPSTSTGSFDSPLSGTTRVTFEMSGFDVPAGGEVYQCQNFKNPIGKDVDVLASQSIMSKGSHHMFAFRYDKNEDDSLEMCSGTEFHEYVHVAQAPNARITYPSGIGTFLGAQEGIRLQAHFLNTGSDTVHASVKVALDYVDSGQVKYHAAQIFLNNGSLSVPPGKSSASATLALPTSVGDIHLLNAQSHMHRQGVHFESTTGDGTPIYSSDSWNEPAPQTYDPPIALPSGSSITWKCDYENPTSATLTFGESASTNEMCIFVGLYYPAPDGNGITGDTRIKTTILGQVPGQ